MNDIKVFSIGKIVNEEENVKVVVEQKYAEGLKGLEGYSHVQILWWMDGCDNASDRGTLVEEKPYRNGPDEISITMNWYAHASIDTAKSEVQRLIA